MKINKFSKQISVRAYSFYVFSYLTNKYPAYLVTDIYTIDRVIFKMNVQTKHSSAGESAGFFYASF